MNVNSMTLDLAQTNVEKANQQSVLSSVSTSDHKKIDQLARDFESIFTQIMLKSMRKTVPKSEVMGGGNGEDIFRSMLDGEYAKSMSKQSEGGLATAIKDFLLRTHAGSNPQSAVSRYNEVTKSHNPREG